MTTERCVGCGAEVEMVPGPVHRYMTSAPACFARYGELLALLAADGGAQDVRVMCADAYAAQHPGTPGPQAIQSVAVHLLNMYSYVVLGQAVHLPRVDKTRTFHWLTPPTFGGARTVFDMPLDGPRIVLQDAAKAWAESVWTAWREHHRQIESWYSRSIAR